MQNRLCWKINIGNVVRSWAEPSDDDVDVDVDVEVEVEVGRPLSPHYQADTCRWRCCAPTPG